MNTMNKFYPISMTYFRREFSKCCKAAATQETPIVITQDGVPLLLLSAISVKDREKYRTKDLEKVMKTD